MPKTKIKNVDMLKLIHYLVESDAGFESDCVMMDKLQNRPVSKRELILAELVSKIYKIVHPRFSNCPHDSWENETIEMIKKLEK